VSVSRREFLTTSGAVGLGFLGLEALFGCDRSATDLAASGSAGFGPLRRDARRRFDLPSGFRYTIVSSAGERMDDGLLVPHDHDGMGAFEGPDGTTVLVRNHECLAHAPERGPFGNPVRVPSSFPAELLYDAGGGRPPGGGTTTLVYDTSRQELRSHHLSLAGTTTNCSGGVTPWGSWLSCEEQTLRRGEHRIEQSPPFRFEKDHGWVFEVPSSAEGPVPPRPLRDLGRFLHEAAVVHAATGIVYMTEDRDDGLLYRFLPSEPGVLGAGGRLQALVLRGLPGVSTSNHSRPDPAAAAPSEHGAADGRTPDAAAGSGERPAWPRSADRTLRFDVGSSHPVEWIDLDEIESPQDDLRYRGRRAGAAVFSRGEGMWAGDEIWFDCTVGGAARLGQIWRYRPSPFEGTEAEDRAPGRLELFLESTSQQLLTNSDNLTLTPWGDLFVCEDHVAPRGNRQTHLVGVTPDGEAYPVGRLVGSDSELCGCVFSPDGSTLFVNVQRPGSTLAITGPWKPRSG
jgi:secreted PhoX family phosphatase